MKFNFFKSKKTSNRIYLDYAAATPVRREVFEAMKPFFTEHFGNAGAVHSEGAYALKAVEDARTSVARTLHVRATDVTFTSGGTESNNLAIYGSLRAVTDSSKSFSDLEIISCKTEHPSTLRALEHIEEIGVTLRYVDVLEDGLIDEKHLATLLTNKTALITFAYANSEIGVVQNVKRITRMVRAFNTEHNAHINVHLDASQAPLWLPIQMDALGVDMMTLDSGKCYGPKGVGILAHRYGVALKSVMLGGSQESGLRAGTENTPLIVGCTTSLEIAQKKQKQRSERVSKLRDKMISALLEKVEGAVLNGSAENRLANNINISIPEINTEFAVVTLDAQGIAVSTKSACSGADGSGSYVVLETTKDSKRAVSTIRFSLGEETTESEIKKTVEILATHTAKMRAFQKTLT